MTYTKGVRGRLPENLSGKVFNRLTAIKQDASKTRRVYWRCQCICGSEVSVPACDLKSGHTKSCGCANRESRVSSNTKHGYNRSPTYVVWSNMLARCSNPKRPDYKNYGGRGILVCDQWKIFANFLADMGQKPEGLTLDRIDNDGNYEPNNCRWATVSEQRRNQRPLHAVRAAAEIGRNMT